MATTTEVSIGVEVQVRVSPQEDLVITADLQHARLRIRPRGLDATPLADGVTLDVRKLRPLRKALERVEWQLERHRLAHESQGSDPAA